MKTVNRFSDYNDKREPVVEITSWDISMMTDEEFHSIWGIVGRLTRQQALIESGIEGKSAQI